jgi:hypothetical protein
MVNGKTYSKCTKVLFTADHLLDLVDLIQHSQAGLQRINRLVDIPRHLLVPQ